ncbi:MAG: thioredoxin domain-containing protein, partial [Candidatus Magasanikbacteria bacterium]|nr:thioredoxin domain-containing protein [Candidatus Magasanikbacteria bacterium]
EHGTWLEVKKMASEKNLKIFVDDFTTWCGPCKMMSSKVFKDTAVGNFYNTYFVNYKLDMESEEGIAFGKLFPVEAYPTFLFFDDSIKLVKKKVGYTEALLFLEMGKSIAEPELTAVYLTQLALLKLKLLCYQSTQRFRLINGGLHIFSG